MISCEKPTHIHKNERWFMAESSKCHKTDAERERKGENSGRGRGEDSKKSLVRRYKVSGNPDRGTK